MGSAPVATDIAAQHIPVLLHEVLEALQPQRGGRYLDGTLGLGGHTEALLQASEQVEVCALDRDERALELAGQRLAPFAGRAHLFHSCYDNFATALDSLGWDQLDGVLLDIGVSSMQLDSPNRGFSFVHDGPLDMRMSVAFGDAPVSALVNRSPIATLKDIIEKYGEDPQAGRIARAIVTAREKKPLETTLELAHVVEQAYPPAWRHKARNHPATRTFQALRMAVNDELGQLERFLEHILPRVKPGGRIAIISFHSLEDRLVKHAMRGWAKEDAFAKRRGAEKILARILTPKPLVASLDEVKVNSRAGCAKLRVAERHDAKAQGKDDTRTSWRKPRRHEGVLGGTSPKQRMQAQKQEKKGIKD